MRGSDLTGDPDRVAVHRCGAVVAPACARRVTADLRLVAREAVVRVGACATRYVVPLADPGVGVDRGVRRTRVVAVPGVGERHDSTPVAEHGHRRVREVVPRRAEVARLDDLAGVRIHDVPRNPGTRRAAVRPKRGIESAPDLAVGVEHLLHAGVVRVRPRDDLVVRRLSAEQEAPAASLAVEQQRARVVDAVSLRSSDARRRTGARLLLFRRHRIRPDVEQLGAQAERGRCRVQRRRVPERPEDDLVRHVVAACSGRRMRRLVGGVRAQEVLGAAVVRVERPRRRLRRPDREARLRRARVARSVHHAGRVDVLHVHDCGTCGELRLRVGVDLRTGEAVAAPRVRIGGDVEPVGVRPDVRVVAEVRAGVRAADVRPVIRDIGAVDVPAAGRIRRLADSDVEVVHERERAVRPRLERQHDDEEALRRCVVETGRIRDELAANAGRPVDRGRVAVERVQVDRVVHVPREPGHNVRRRVVRQHGVAGGVVDVQDVIDGLDDVAVPCTHALVGRLDGELVPAARIALLVEVQALEAGVELRIRLRLLAGGGRDAYYGPAGGQAPVDDVAAVRIGTVLVLLPGELVTTRAVPGCERPGRGRARSGFRNKRARCTCARRGSGGGRQNADDQREDRKQPKFRSPSQSHCLPHGVIGGGEAPVPPGLRVYASVDAAKSM